MGKYVASWNGNSLMVRFERGDVVRVCLNATQSLEAEGKSCLGLVLSTAKMNSLGTAIIALITQSGDFSRYTGFAVPLSVTGMNTHGVVLVNMIRSVDLLTLGAKKIDRAPQVVIDDALARLQAVLE